ncbi:MAG: outer membrane beta-barrel protein, partial [Ignavibacteriae bacterium]|nr:outer membrane beta-barrel protein [Ignavibacteriota bacterium]
GKTVTAQGYNEPVTSFDILLKKTLINKRASISFKIVDLFNTLKYTYHINSMDFTQISDRKRITRTAFLILTYTIGSDESGLDKRKKKKEENGNKDEEE